MIRLPIEFKEFLKLLSEFQFDYLVAGGYAVAYHGYPRATGDMDIWIAMSPENAEKVMSALRAVGFGETGASSELFIQPDQVTRMGVPPLRIEILTTVSGLDFSDAFSRRIVDQIDGTPISLVGLEDLRRNKRAAGRKKDLADLDNLP